MMRVFKIYMVTQRLLCDPRYWISGFVLETIKEMLSFGKINCLLSVNRLLLASNHLSDNEGNN